MKEKKIEIPLELDAAVIQYAASKNFQKRNWYWSLPARAAVLVFAGAVLAYIQFGRDNGMEQIVHTEEIARFGSPEWSDFEEKIEFVDDEILAEAKYLAQL